MKKKEKERKTLNKQENKRESKEKLR